MKALKFLLALLLWLPCAALTLTLYHQAAALGFGHGPWLERPLFWMAMGFCCWLAIFGLVGPSARAYIISHELTHAIWTLLMGGRVSGFAAGPDGGHIKVSKENWLITLSPYFVPFYTLLAIGLFHLAGVWWDTRPFIRGLFYLVGFTWSFHLAYTLTVLRQSQSDVRRHGWAFSMTVIYGMNLLVVAFLMAGLSPRVTLGGLAGQFWMDCIFCWQQVAGAWGQCGTAWRRP
jgi:hypothetical protein